MKLGSAWIVASTLLVVACGDEGGATGTDSATSDSTSSGSTPESTSGSSTSDSASSGTTGPTSTTDPTTGTSQRAAAQAAARWGWERREPIVLLHC